MDADGVQRRVAGVAEGFARDRRDRLGRTSLHREDFDALSDAGLRTAILPERRGGLWRDLRSSARPLCELHRVLAQGDPSVALVCSMHPSVLAFWLAMDQVPGDDGPAWERQREQVLDTVADGAWWGTATSEPGTGGDVTRSRAVARRDGNAGGDAPGWRIEGQKHFGSGSGMTSFMLTTAVAEGEDGPDWFYVPMPPEPFDGRAGVRLLAAWDGHGMLATQSHALALEGVPAHRVAWPGHLQDLIAAAAPFFGALFSAVVLGVLQSAVEAARAQLAPRAEALRAFERVEWAQAELEAWTAEQAYEGILRAIESGRPARGAAVRGKTAIAQLAESSMTRVCRVVGGGTFARSSPFGAWFEDVRALGFLRPPWGLAYDSLFAEATPAPAESA